MRVGVDVGGTFTDLVGWDGARLATAKVPTTLDQGEGIGLGLGSLSGGAAVQLLLHGTTVATNALLERKGAKTALITDAGFEDLVEIARQDRPSLYDPFADRPAALVEREDRWGVDDELELLLSERGPEAVAVALLNSYRDGAAELAIGERVRTILPRVSLSLSHLVSGEFREYERTATTVLNAYLQPPVARYLDALEGRTAGVVERLLVMQSNGGLTSTRGASDLAASILLSGPAGGVMAAAACGAAHGWEQLISLDMGGTSTDVGRIEAGRPAMGSERSVGGMTCRMPSIAIHTIGAGGGSVAWADSGGSLRVGPQSAGAHPGPASYGQGGSRPTVTDANLVAGRLGVERPLAGGIRLDVSRGREAIARLGDELGMDVGRTAMGILEVANALMERAVRKVSIEQGADPRRSPLLAFGGAGALHATSLARRLDMPAVLIPPHCGVFSALGLLLSPTRTDVSRTVFTEEGDPLIARIALVLDEASKAFRQAVGENPERTECRLDMRYRGQSHETTVEFREGDGWPSLIERFHQAHLQANGFSRPGEVTEIVTIRAAALRPPVVSWSSIPWRFEESSAEIGERGLVDGDRVRRWWRPALRPADEVIGPAVIEEEEAATLVGTGERAQVLEDGSIEVTW
ncbi:MAG: hydantoinase/oxoprolinase family protein [Actinomycetota bacterium]